MDIRLVNINKSFGEKQILREVSMTFIEGGVTCLMGPSGSGKTSLVNLLLGITKPDSGKLEGMEGRRVSAVFQEDRLIEHWDAVKNIQLVCSKEVTEEIIHFHLKEVGLTDYEGKSVNAFSGGMRRRVAIIRAILSTSDLIVMDEPFKGLDSALKLQIVQYIKKYTTNKTLILITHDKEDVVLFEGDLFMVESI